MTHKFRSLNKHHVLPSSRGGTKKDIIMLDSDFHSAWHYCFENMTVDEAILMIRIMFRYENSGSWSHGRLRRLRYAIKNNDDVELYELLEDKGG